MEDVPRVWLLNDHGIRVLTMTDATLPDALRVMRSAFYTDEPISMGFRLQETPEAIDDLEQLSLEVYKDGVSLVAVDRTGVVVGGLFSKIQRKPKQGDVGLVEYFIKEKFKTDKAKEYMDIVLQMDGKSDPFSHYGVDSLLDTMYLATDRQARKQGVGLALIDAARLVAREKDLPLVFAIYSNKGSQRIGQKLGWDLLMTVPMSDFLYRGLPISEFTGENQTLHIMAIKV